MKTVILWYRNDLRVNDHPALSYAAGADHIVPVFIFDDALLHGRHGSSNRNRFLLESLLDLKISLQKLGADLAIRWGKAEEVILQLAHEVSAGEVVCSEDLTPYAVSRDHLIATTLASADITFSRFPGRLAIDAVDGIQTGIGTPYRVFTPFYNRWLSLPRRALVPVPPKLSLPPALRLEEFPSLGVITSGAELSPNVLPGGETSGRQRLKKFLSGPIDNYHLSNDAVYIEGTSRLSAYLHFGCLSVREIEAKLPPSEGAAAWHRQLCWRDFYHYILSCYPGNATLEHQERYRDIMWNHESNLLQPWKDGQTGYPIVDAAMRQLKSEGWMHNRARLIVGSFLTKDLGLDWRAGERHFMHWLIDGDEANNNGNWQWIASVGVDPAPVFRRLYNPARQQDRFDPEGKYVRHYVPELANVPQKFLSEPWKMDDAMQESARCRIGADYPFPIVDHTAARLEALDRYRR